MKTKYKYIEFKKDVSGVWHCGNHKTDDYLGRVMWVKRWKCYEFVPNEGTAYTVECLADLADFIRQLEQEKV